MVAALVRQILILAVSFLVLLAYLYFRPLLAFWLIALALTTYFRSTIGLAVLFVTISVNTAEPILGGLVVDYPEFEFAVVLGTWAATVSNFRSLNWKPVLWCAPFLGTVALSGLVNVSWFKVLPHVLRMAEFAFAAFLASNICRAGVSLSGSRPLNRGVFRLDPVIGASLLLYLSIGFVRFYWGESARIFSSFGNPNQFAGYLVLLLPFAVMAFLAAESFSRQCVWVWLTALTLAGLIATQSRGGLLGAFVGMFVVGILFTRRSSHGVTSEARGTGKVLVRRMAFLSLSVALIFVVATLVILFSGFSGSLEAPVKSFEKRMAEGIGDAFIEYRMPFIHVGWEMWKDHPLFGVGPGRYKEMLREYEALVVSFEGKMKSYRYFKKDLRVHTHNLYLQMAVDFGLFGLLCYLFMLGKLIFELTKQYQVSLVRMAGIGLLVGFLAHNLFDVTFPSLSLEMGILIGAALAALGTGGLGQQDAEGLVSDHRP